jgi:PTS system nitrogen regulatory IIA component
MKISAKEAASVLNMSEDQMYQLIERKEIPCQKINEDYLFNRAELLEWATSKGIAVSPDLFSNKGDEEEALPTLSEAMKRGGVLYNIEGTTKTEVLRSIVDRMPLPAHINRQFLFQTLIARESLGSTGIGNGIAIPHVRNPLVLHVEEPIICLSFLKTPIDFKSIDGKPVNTLFTIISPTVRIHLHLLSRITYMLKQQEFLELIQKQGSLEEILKVLINIESQLP